MSITIPTITSGYGTCSDCGATCTKVTLTAPHDITSRYLCTVCLTTAAAKEIASWLNTGFITLTATTKSGTRYTVWKRPGKPTVVIHPDGNVYRGTLIVAFGTQIMLVNSRGQEILHTTPVTDVYVMEN